MESPTEAQRNRIISDIDQNWAAAVEAWDRLSVGERTNLVLWLSAFGGDVRNAPAEVRRDIKKLASAALLETGYRWRMRQHE